MWFYMAKGLGKKHKKNEDIVEVPSLLYSNTLQVLQCFCNVALFQHDNVPQDCRYYLEDGENYLDYDYMNSDYNAYSHALSQKQSRRNA